MNPPTLRWGPRNWISPTWIIGTEPAQFANLPPFNTPIWVLFDPIGHNALEDESPVIKLCRAVPGSMGALVTYFEWVTADFIDTNAMWSSVAWCLTDTPVENNNAN